MHSFIQNNHRRIFFTYFTILILLLFCGNFLFPLGYVCFIHFWKLSPRVQVTETYQIESGVMPMKVRVESLNVRIIYSQLGLFNWQSLVQYSIKGTIFNSATYYDMYIEKILVSQRYLRLYENKSSTETSPWSGNPEALIEVQPLVGRKALTKNKAPLSEQPFSVTNQMVVTSLHMGENVIRFKCDEHWVDVALYQMK